MVFYVSSFLAFKYRLFAFVVFYRLFFMLPAFNRYAVYRRVPGHWHVSHPVLSGLFFYGGGCYLFAFPVVVFDGVHGFDVVVTPLPFTRPV